LDFPLLQDAQQLRLEGRRDLTDLVQEQRAAAGALEAAGTRRDGAGEGALFVAEQLALQHALGERLHVDGDERPGHPVAPEMQLARDQLLAGAALTLNQHGRLARRHAPHQLEQLAAAWTLGDHRLGRVAARDFLAEVAVLALETREIECARDAGTQLVVVERLDDVVEGAFAHAATADGTLPNAVSMMTGRRGPAGVNAPQQLGAVHAGIFQSVTTTSAPLVSSAASTSSPRRYVSQRYPARANAAATTAAMRSSSSTISTRGVTRPPAPAAGAAAAPRSGRRRQDGRGR
jgi:hypothetical protein